MKYCTIKDGYLFFLKGRFSQWWTSKFIDEDGVEFRCCEQYMMYKKALLFGDNETASKIIEATDPSEHKRLGRLVKNFNEEIWNQHKERIVYEGNIRKFSQNEDFKDMLLSTENLILVEANGNDRIWGIGMFVDDPNIMKTELWGENLLGKTLMKVREKLKNE